MRFARWVPLADQVMANASNALFVLLVAGASSSSAFGRFAVGYSVLVFAVGVWRNGLSYHVSLRAGDSAGLEDESNRAVAVTLLTSPVLAALILVIVGIGPGANPALAWGLALATPFVLTQDLLRYSAVAAGRAPIALVSDSAWTGFLVVALVLRIQGQLTASELIGLWVVGAVVACGILGLALRTSPRFAGSRTWIRQSWLGRTHLVTAGVISGLSVPVTAAVVAVLAGPAVAGGIAGAGVLMAPTNTLVAWLSLTLLARAAHLSDQDSRATFIRAGLATAALTLVWGFALLLVPDWLGEALLGQTWPSSAEAIPIVGLQYGVGVLASTGGLLLVALGLSRAFLASALVVAIARVCFGWVAAATVATVFSVAVAETLAMGMWLACVLLYLRPRLREVRHSS